jgi:hypothetical protein
VSTLREPLPALALLSVLSADWPAFWPKILEELKPCFGQAEFVSEPLDFSHTSYYDAEMGTPLARRILAFAPLMPLDGLVRAKLAAVELEQRHARPDGTRRVNLDPGLLTYERLVLATGKNFPHRIYLGQRVFADLTLVYGARDGWRALPWTFPDYAEPGMLELLTRLRGRYAEKLGELGLAPLKK